MSSVKRRSEASDPAAVRGRVQTVSEELTSFIERMQGPSAAAPTHDQVAEALRVADDQIHAQLDELDRVARSLAELRSRHDELFTFVPEALLYTDRLGTIHDANPASELLLGRQIKHLRGKPLPGFIAREHVPSFRSAIDSLGSSGSREIELDLLGPHGTREKVCLRGVVASNRHHIIWVAQVASRAGAGRAHRSGTYRTVRATAHEREEVAARVVEQLDKSLHLALDQVAVLARFDTDHGQRRQAAIQMEKVLRAHTTLAADIIEVTRLAEGTIIPSVASVDLAAVLELTAHALMQEAGARGVRIMHTAPPSLEIEGDHARLTQAVLGVVCHALDAAPVGSTISIAAMGAEGSADVLVSHAQKVGAPQPSDEVFEWLNAPDVSALGTHLTLRIARENVALHGGTLSYMLDAASNASFVMRLPAPDRPK